MSKKTNKYTVSVYTEDSVGLLNRISAIFQRRHINIESFNSSMTEIESVQRWTILILTTEVQIKKIVGQINRQIEVIKAYYHTDEETIYQESCLFKIKSSLVDFFNSSRTCFKIKCESLIEYSVELSK